MFNSRTVRYHHLKQACIEAAANLQSTSSFHNSTRKEKQQVLNAIAHKVAAMQAPQYYVDQLYAYNVLSAHFAGGHPLPARGLAHKKWQEIATHVRNRRKLKPKESLIDSIANVLASQKASNFFLTTTSIRRFLNSIAI